MTVLTISPTSTTTITISLLSPALTHSFYLASTFHRLLSTTTLFLFLRTYMLSLLLLQNSLYVSQVLLLKANYTTLLVAKNSLAITKEMGRMGWKASENLRKKLWFEFMVFVLGGGGNGLILNHTEFDGPRPESNNEVRLKTTTTEGDIARPHLPPTHALLVVAFHLFAFGWLCSWLGWMDVYGRFLGPRTMNSPIDILCVGLCRAPRTGFPWDEIGVSENAIDIEGIDSDLVEVLEGQRNGRIEGL